MTINGINYLSFNVNDTIGLTQLPVITSGSRRGTNAWTWNGDVEKPTLRPSIRTTYHNGTEMTEIHYWLTDGIAHCLSDCKDGNSGKKIKLQPIDTNIPLTEEPKEYFEATRVYENCYFKCGNKTKYWHMPTNQPICVECAKTRNVSEIKKCHPDYEYPIIQYEK